MRLGLFSQIEARFKPPTPCRRRHVVDPLRFANNLHLRRGVGWVQFDVNKLSHNRIYHAQDNAETIL